MCLVCWECREEEELEAVSIMVRQCTGQVHREIKKEKTQAASFAMRHGICKRGVWWCLSRILRGDPEY